LLNVLKSPLSSGQQSPRDYSETVVEQNTENNSKVGNQVFDIHQFSARDGTRAEEKKKKVSWVRSHTPKPVSRKVQELEDTALESRNHRALSPRSRGQSSP
jgi:hypothetical protein